MGAITIIHPWAKDYLQHQACCNDCGWYGRCGTLAEADAERKAHVCPKQDDGRQG